MGTEAGQSTGDQGAQTTTVPRGTWRVASEGSHVGFKSRKLGLYYVKGKFRRVEGRIELGTEPNASRGEVVIDATSIYTRMPPRDWHLRTRDFLDIKRHPQIRITAESLEQGPEGHFEVPAEIEIHGVRKPVRLGGHFHESTDGPAVRLHLHGVLDRHEFGVRALGPVDWIVGREVHVDVELLLEPAS